MKVSDFTDLLFLGFLIVMMILVSYFGYYSLILEDYWESHQYSSYTIVCGVLILWASLFYLFLVRSILENWVPKNNKKDVVK